MGSLFIIATPIGNREDITRRALRVLGELDYLLCEDTRKTGELLQFYGIKPPLLESYYQPVEERKILRVLNWLKSGKNVGLVTNAGTPLISDPGFKLVRECVNLGIPVISIPGASALLTALTVSGLPTDKFTFLGFLPKKEAKKEKLLKTCQYTVIAYESPFRLVKTLALIARLFPERQVAVCRELTKKFEEIVRGKTQEVLSKFQNRPTIKGEVVILIGTSGRVLEGRR